MGRLALQPTDSDRAQVKRLSGLGLTQDQISTHMGISDDTLRKYYPEELKKGVAEINAKIVGALFKNAMEGNVAAQIFWCKSRLGWKETTVQEVKVDTTFVDGPPQETRDEWEKRIALTRGVELLSE